MNKKIISLVLLLIISVSSVYSTSDAQNIRIPDSFAINGVLFDGTSIFNNDNSPSIVSPMMLLAKEYRGNLTASFNGYEYAYAYLYGTTVRFTEGASPNYKLNTTQSVTKTTSWSIGGNIGTNDKAKIQLDIMGQYGSTKTATIVKGEEWSCGFTIPGLYDLTWYMRGHRYSLYADMEWIDTGINDGKITHEYIGNMYLPTTEITFNIQKVY